MFETRLRDGKIVMEYIVRTQCPMDKSRLDVYDLRIEYVPAGWIMEYFTFKEYLDLFIHEKMFHEDLWQQIYDLFIQRVKPKKFNMELVDNSPGMKIKVMSIGE